jgi:hypothetical protein
VLDYDPTNRYENPDGSFTNIDNTEDVDIYKVTLKAGDTSYVDTDANQFEPGRKVDPGLRVFDATGTELAGNEDGAAPDEIFIAKWESYVEFTAPSDGDYYIGVGLYSNRNYDPNVPGSGSGGDEGESGTDPDGYGPGEYTININLNEPFVAPPTSIPRGDSSGPVISLFTVVGTYNGDFDNLDFGIVSPGVVETAPEGTGTAINFVITADGEIPEGGIEVFVNSDIVLTDYIGDGENPSSFPFSRGGQFLDAIYNAQGNVTGFKFLLEQPFATIVLNPNNREEAETDGPETATFSLVESAGYQVSDLGSSTVTFYDTVDQVPAPTVVPEVSISLSTAELIESAETPLTITLSLDTPPPIGGLQVYVSGNAADFLNEFSIFEAQITGGVAVADGAVSGFYFQMLEQTATITLPVFNSVDIIEGIEQFNVSLVPDPGYTINEDSEATLTIKDNPESLIQVNLSSQPEVLVEADETVATFNFSLSAAPPEEGLLVTLTSSSLSDFTQAIGGQLSSLTFKLTEQNASISLPVNNDGIAEGLEEVTFTLQPGNGYQVGADASSVTFSIADTTELAPVSTAESNDTIATAIATGLNGANTVTFAGEIAQHTTGEDDTLLQVDATEDVDFYQVVLKAGDTITADIDTVEYTVAGLDVAQRLGSQLRLFDADGNQLVLVNNAPAPDELFVAGRDPYFSYTATTDGTYYIGVSQLGNSTYDPFTAGSGSGRININNGQNIGEYELTIGLTPTVSLT